MNRLLDIELTNRCNARCSFCPRDQTPATGLMARETFEKCLDRVLEADPPLWKVGSAGQGESCLHPELLDFARLAKERGAPYGVTTNGSLLTREISEGLHEADISHIVFSFGDLGEDYEEVYALDFETSYQNVMYFLELNKQREKPIHSSLSLVLHDINRPKQAETVAFWKERGMDELLVFEQNNRGGACDNGDYFVQSGKYVPEAIEILRDEGLSHICGAPFTYLFIGWNGQYYICCNDYRKTTALGSVFDYSIAEMDEIKRDLMADGGMGVEACRECNLNPINRVREGLLEIEHGVSSKGHLKKRVRKLRIMQGA